MEAYQIVSIKVTGIHLAGFEKAGAIVAGGMSPAGLPPARTAVIGSSWSSQSLSTKENLDRKVRYVS